MPARHPVRALLLCSAAFSLPASAFAQDAMIELAPITVQSKREVQTDTALAETIVDAEEIQDRQADTIADLIETAPGVNLINGGTPTGSGINIRGFGASGSYGTDSKVGVFVGGASKGSEELYRIGTQLYTDPNLYREAKVLRGVGGTLEYGSGFFGGMIRLEPIQAADMTDGEPGFKLRQLLQYSSNGDGAVSSTTLAWQPNDWMELLANYTWRDTGLPTDPNGTELTTDNSVLPSWLINSRFTFGNSGEQQLSFLLSETESEELDVPYDSFSWDNSMFGNVDRRVKDRTAALRYEYASPTSDLLNLHAELSYSDQDISLEDLGGGMFPLDLKDADYRYETTTLLVKNTANIHGALASHELRTGVELQHRERFNSNSDAPGGIDKRLSLFLVDDITMGALTLTPQLRAEKQWIAGTKYGYGEYENDTFMGGVSALYDLGGGFSVLGGLHYNESLPIIDDIAGPNADDFMNTVEKATTIEAGFAYEGADLLADGDALSFKLLAYDTHVWDNTTYGMRAGPGTTVHYDAIDLWGAEIEANYSMASGFYVDANANIARGSYTLGADRGDFSGVPNDELRLSLGRKFGDELDLSWEAVFAADMDRASTSSDGYVVHNLRATYKPQLGMFEGTEVRLGIENLLDEVYKPHLAQRNGPGRTIKVSLAKTF